MLINLRHKIAPSVGNAVEGDVRALKTFSNASGTGKTGTLTDKTGSATILTPGSTDIAIPVGIFDGALGSGKVAGVVVPAANVLAGTTIAGTAGTMPNNGAVAITPSNAAHAIAAGYHNGSGSVAALTVNATDNIFIEDPAQRTFVNPPYTKISPQFTINYAGTIRIKFTICGSGATNQTFGRVYKNGIAIGTERSTPAGTSTNYSFTEDFTCNIGDYFEIYCYTNAYTGYLKDVQICGYLSIAPNIVVQV